MSLQVRVGRTLIWPENLTDADRPAAIVCSVVIDNPSSDLNNLSAAYLIIPGWEPIPSARWARTHDGREGLGLPFGKVVPLPDVGEHLHFPADMQRRASRLGHIGFEFVSLACRPTVADLRGPKVRVEFTQARRDVIRVPLFHAREPMGRR